MPGCDCSRHPESTANSETEGCCQHAYDDDQGEEQVEGQGGDCQAALDGRYDAGQAAAGCEWGQAAHPQAADRAPQQGGIQGVAYVAVFLLQDAEGAVVAGKLVEVKADERDQCSGGDEKGQDADRREKIATLFCAVEIDAAEQCGSHKTEKGQLHGTVGQSGNLAGHAVRVGAEQAAAAGGYHIGLHVEEVDELKDHLQQHQRYQYVKQAVFGSDQRVVVAAGVHMIDYQPDPSQKTIYNFQYQNRITETVDRQAAGRAHGPCKLAVQAVGGEDVQEQGAYLEHQDVAEDYGDQVGAPFQVQLQLTATLQVPLVKDASTVPAGVDQHDGRQQ